MAKPIIAIMYDFDKTLSTKDMQEYSFIPELGMTPAKFWEETAAFKQKNRMDSVLAYMWLMIKGANKAGIPIRREKFVKLGEAVKFHKGVEEWFEHINACGKEHNVSIEHYIISSGLKEIIEGSKLAGNFKAIFASEYFYDENGVAVWPKLAVNYTGKTQFLFRINKGVLNVYDDDKINAFTSDDERRIPFRNMIYIGDGMTDVPCMKLVKVNGGQSIAVYRRRSSNSKDIVKTLLKEARADYFAVADYSPDGELAGIVQKIISEMVLKNELVKLHETKMNEALNK